MAPTTPPSGASAAPSPNPLPSSLPLAGPRLGPSQDGNRIIRKRNRIPLSCAPCRQRKLKCNRSQPCENCVKRGDTASCSYAAATSRRKGPGGRGPLALNPDDMQDRINRLEALVLNLVTEQNQAGGASVQQSPMSPVTAARNMMNPGAAQELTPSSTTEQSDAMDGGHPEPESETERVTNSLGVMHVHQNKSLYIGNTHWAAVLEDIHEVKNYFIEHKKMYEDQIQAIKEHTNQSGANTSIGPSFLLNSGPTPILSDLLNNLPSKDTADKLVDVYFEQYDRMIHVLHPPSWRRTYNNFWTNQAAADPAFVAQIFAVMGIALQAMKRAGQEPQEFLNRSEGIATRYRQNTVQCLQLVDYSKPSLYILEALVLHTRGEYHRSKETNSGVWVLNAMIVRIAMRMGLHRDAKHYGNITPFIGEMRRRLWTWISMSDTLYSQQGGLPSMIRPQDCDTQFPSNIYDEEFDEATAVLPDSRPTSEFTPTTYMIAKATLTKNLSQVLDINSELSPTSYDEVMRLDGELAETYTTMPSILRTSDETQTTEPAVMHMRYSIAMLYHKTMCTLHREYITKAREDDRYRDSRRRCIDSAVKLLQYQAAMHYEGRAGGRLPGLAWFDASIASSDFLLAATIVSLDLWYSAQAQSLGRPNEDVATWGHDRMAEMRQALVTSRDIWLLQRDSSMEAFKAAEIIGVMLAKVDSVEHTSASAQPAGSSQAFPYSPDSKDNVFRQRPDESKPEQQAAMTLGMLSTGIGQNGANNQQSSPGFSSSYPTPSSGQPTPGSLAAAARAVQDLNNNAFDQTAGNFANFFQTGMPQNIDWSELDNLMMPTHNDPAPAMPDITSGMNMNWPSDQGLRDIVDSDIALPQQPADLNTNLFANGGFSLGSNQPM